MSKWMLAAGAAALAIVSPSLAGQGGQGGGKDKGQAAKVERGGGGKGQAARTQRGGGKQQVRAASGNRSGDQPRARPVRVAQDDNRGRKRDNVRVESRGNDRARTVRIDDDRGRGRDNARIEARGRDDVRMTRFEDRGRGRDANVRTVKID